MNGVIYYNYGKKMLVRLVCSLNSLRRFYDGPVNLYLEGYGKEECKIIADYYKVNIIEVDFGEMYSRKVYLNACLVSKKSEFDNSVWIDADTLILNNFDNLFKLAEENDFVISQLSDWKTNKGVIAKRILGWNKFYSKDIIDTALNFGPAINCGVFAFNRRSELVRDWFDFAEKGKSQMIPDEVGCQIMLPRYKHKIIGNEYNVSCKHGVVNENSKIIHYHGRKHCRIENGKFIYNSDLWYKEFNKIRKMKVVEENIQYDRQLRNYIKEYGV
jgi:hypothetical protein